MKTKNCIRCKKVKQLDEFPTYIDNRRKGVVYYIRFCRPCYSAYRKSTRSRDQEYQKKYRDANKEKIKKRNKKYADMRYRTNREKVCKMQVKYQRVYKENLSNGYIKRLLTKNNDLTHADITPEYVELKRKEVLLKRFLKEQ